LQLLREVALHPSQEGLRNASELILQTFLCALVDASAWLRTTKRQSQAVAFDPCKSNDDWPLGLFEQQKELN
jgi:hypothetical protein